MSKFVKKGERKDAYEEPKFTNLYVKNLGEFVTEDILVEKFSEYGKVRNVLIMKDAEGKSKGFGFVNFESYEEAKKAVEALNGSLLGKYATSSLALAFLSRSRRYFEVHVFFVDQDQRSCLLEGLRRRPKGKSF